MNVALGSDELWEIEFFNIKDKTKALADISLGRNDWGSANCSRDLNVPFGPHGIDLIQRGTENISLRS